MRHCAVKSTKSVNQTSHAYRIRRNFRIFLLGMPRALLASMRHFEKSVFCAGILVACGANDPQQVPDFGKSPPEVSSVEWEVDGVRHPLSERVPYGAQIHIRGSHFASNAQVELKTPSGTLTLPKTRVTETADLTLTVTDNDISFRYPFPALGEVAVVVDGVRTSAGLIEPVWMPVAVDLPIRNEGGGFHMANLLSVRAYPTGDVAALFAHGRLLTIKGAHLREVSPGGSGGFVEGALSDEFGKAFATRPVPFSEDGKHELVSLLLNESVLSEVVLGTKVSSDFLAQGSDGAGEYLWVESEYGKVNRVRVTGESTDRGPIVKPLFGQHGEAGETLADGTLVLIVGENRHSFFDDTAIPVGAALLPTATAFSASNEAGVTVDDEMYSVRASRGAAGIVAVHYCALDSEPFRDTRNECRSSVIRVQSDGSLVNESHAWSSTSASDAGVDGGGAVDDGGSPDGGDAGEIPEEPAPTVYGTSDYAGASPYGTVEATCDSTRAVLRVFTGGTEFDSVYPCMDIVGATVDSAGKPILLLGTQGEVFAVTTR